MPLTEAQKDGIRRDFENPNVGRDDTCGRCLRKNHAMRDCPASRTNSWFGWPTSEGDAAEIYFHELRKTSLARSTPGTNAGPPSASQAPRSQPGQSFRPGTSYAAAVGESAASTNPPVRTPAQSTAPRLDSEMPSVPIRHAPTHSRASATTSSQHQAPPSSNSFIFPTEKDEGAVRVDYLHYAKAEGAKKRFDVSKGSIYQTTVKTFAESNFAVLANYVHVPEIPDQVFVYSMMNSHSFKKKDNTVGHKALSRRKELQNIFQDLHGQHLTQLLVNTSWATDYRTIWTDKLIFNSNPERRTFNLDFVSLGGERLNPLTIEVKHTKTLGSIRKNLQTKQVEECSEEIEALNALVVQPASQRRPGFSVTPIGPNRFFINEAYRLLKSGQSYSPDSVALRAVRGYFTSIRPGKNSGILLNVNTATSAFFPPCRVSDVLYYVGTSQDLASEVGLDDVEKWLRGSQLYVAYLRPPVPGRAVSINHQRSRMKTFQNFGRSIEDQMFFDKNNAQDQGRTVLDYFETVVGIAGLNPEGLCVNVGKPVERTADMRSQCNDGAIWIPAQLLEIVRYQTVKGQLPPTLAASMITTALRNPADNAKLIAEEGLDVLRIPGASNQAVPRPGFNIGTHLVQVPADFLPSPRLQYQYQKGHDVKRPIEASWNLVDEKCRERRAGRPCEEGDDCKICKLGWRLHTGGALDKINVFNLSRALGVGPSDRSDTMRGNLVDRFRHHGMHSVTAGATGSGSLAVLSTFWSNTAQGATRATLVALPDQKQSTYASIRRMSDLQFGLNSVCAITTNNKIRWYPNGYDDGGQPRGFQNQHLDNLTMKFNSKANGLNHALNPDEVQRLLGANSRQHTIVFGADVGHPGSGSLAGVPSIACVVASIDRDLQKYPGSMRLQAGGQETIEDMEAMVLERLEAWVEFRKQNPIIKPSNRQHATGATPCLLPSSILFYRDGVSESQFAELTTREITTIRRAFHTLATRHHQPSAHLKLTFVVVGKRHHTRFFPKTNAESSTRTNSNVKPGLLVEDIVTTPHRYNFYLQSHAAPAGTARSAHYHVLLDDMAFGTENKRLANLTNMLCYCFPRALKGVSYVAPAYIADRMCERGRVYLRPWRPDASFKLPASNNGNTWDKAAITRWKQRKARDIATSATVLGVMGQVERVWGVYDEAVGRWNPWRASLDGVMFWM